MTGRMDEDEEKGEAEDSLAEGPWSAPARAPPGPHQSVKGSWAAGTSGGVSLESGMSS